MKTFIEGYTFDREHDFEFRNGAHYLYAWETKPDEKTPSFIFVTKSMIANGKTTPLSTVEIQSDKDVHVTHEGGKGRIVILDSNEAKAFTEAYETWKAFSILIGAAA